jgi:hypothetical protein
MTTPTAANGNTVPRPTYVNAASVWILASSGTSTIARSSVNTPRATATVGGASRNRRSATTARQVTCPRSLVDSFTPSTTRPNLGRSGVPEALRIVRLRKNRQVGLGHPQAVAVARGFALNVGCEIGDMPARDGGSREATRIASSLTRRGSSPVLRAASVESGRRQRWNAAIASPPRRATRARSTTCGQSTATRCCRWRWMSRTGRRRSARWRRPTSISAASISS